MPRLKHPVEAKGRPEPRLQLRLDHRFGLKVTVVVPRLNGLAALKGSGDLQVDAFNTPALKLSLVGCGRRAGSTDLSTEDLQHQHRPAVVTWRGQWQAPGS
jgi:hypothetical protein